MQLVEVVENHQGRLRGPQNGLGEPCVSSEWLAWQYMNYAPAALLRSHRDFEARARLSRAARSVYELCCCARATKVLGEAIGVSRMRGTRRQVHHSLVDEPSTAHRQPV